MVYFFSFVRQKPEVYDVRSDTSMLPVMVNRWLTIITAMCPYAAGASSCYVPDLSLATKLLWCAVFCSTIKQYQRDKKLPPFLALCKQEPTIPTATFAQPIYRPVMR